MLGMAVTWPTIEAADTSCAASTGSSACSHSGRAVRPVPKPVSPLTKPPASAPASRMANVCHCNRFSPMIPTPATMRELEVLFVNTIS